MAYCTVLLRYPPGGLGTEYHPRHPKGKTQCGEFASEADAHRWASENIRGFAYSVVWVGDDPDALPEAPPPVTVSAPKARRN